MCVFIRNAGRDMRQQVPLTVIKRENSDMKLFEVKDDILLYLERNFVAPKDSLALRHTCHALLHLFPPNSHVLLEALKKPSLSNMEKETICDQLSFIRSHKLLNFENVISIVEFASDEKLVELLRLLDSFEDCLLQLLARFDRSYVIEYVCKSGKHLFKSESRIHEALQTASRFGSERSMLLLLEKSTDQILLSECLKTSICNNQRQIMELLLPLVSICRDHLLSACENGNLFAVKSIHKLSKNFEFSDGYILACNFGHVEIVRFVIENDLIDLVWDGPQGLLGACEFGQRHVVDYLLSMDIPVQQDCLNFAIDSGNLEVVKLLISHPRFKYHDISKILETATSNNDYNIVKLLLETDKIFDTRILDSILYQASMSGNNQVANMILKRFDLDPCIPSTSIAATKADKNVSRIINSLLTNSDISPQTIFALFFEFACSEFHIESVKTLLSDRRIREIFKIHPELQMSRNPVLQEILEEAKLA